MQIALIPTMLPYPIYDITVISSNDSQRCAQWVSMRGKRKATADRETWSGQEESRGYATIREHYDRVEKQLQDFERHIHGAPDSRACNSNTLLERLVRPEDLKHLGWTPGEAKEGLFIWPSEMHNAVGRPRSKGEDELGGVCDWMGTEGEGQKDEDGFTWRLSLLTHDAQLPLQWCHLLPLVHGLVRGNHQGQSVSIACNIHYRSARRPRRTVAL